MQLLAANSTRPSGGHRPISPVQKIVVLGLLMLGTIVIFLLLGMQPKSTLPAGRSRAAASSTLRVGDTGR